MSAQNPSPDGAPSSSTNNNEDRTGRGGRGRGRGRGGRGRGGQGSNKFQGQEPSLADCTFDYSEDPQSKRYLKNVELLVGYVGANHSKYNMEFQKAVEQLELNDPEPIVKPKDEDADNFFIGKEWEFKFKAREEQIILYNGFRSSFYSVLLGQCTPLLRDKLRAKKEFQAIQDARDGIALLKLIKTTMFTFDSGRVYTAVSRDRLKEEYYGLKRQNNQSLQSYYEVFRSKVKLITEMGIKLYDHDFLIEIATKNKRTDNKPTADDEAEAQERCIAIRFIRTCGHRSYEVHLQNTFLDGGNYYPATLADARAIIDNRINIKNQYQSNSGSNSGGQQNATGVAFNTGTADHEQHGSQQGSQHQTVTESDETISHAMSFSSSIQANIPKSWILLDNQSTVDIISNKNLIKNIRKSKTPITIHSHAGSRVLTQIADLPSYGVVWFDPDGPVNLLSFHNAKNNYQVEYQGDKFTLQDKSGKVKYTFKPSTQGLYYMDTEKNEHSFLTTVKDNEAKYSQSDVDRAKGARQLQISIGCPSTKEFLHIVSKNMLPNCPYTREDIKRAEAIYGPDIGTLKGKTTRRKSPTVPLDNLIPPAIDAKYREIVIAMDIMHVNGVPFLTTLSRHLYFTTIDALESTSMEHIFQCLKRTVNLYRRTDLRPRILLADGAFKNDYMEQQLATIGMALNPAARNEHVGDIERRIRTIKERMRATYNMLPFDIIPKIMVIELAKQAVFWLNSFPHQGGISDTISPRELVTGSRLDYHRHCRYEFGEYVQCHEEHDNSMSARTVGALALRPTGNRQGGFYFLSLASGRVINRNHATKVPMPQGVIDRITKLAEAQSAQPGLAFGNRDNRILLLDDDNEIYNEDDDEDYEPEQDQDEDLRYDAEFVAEELADEPLGPVDEEMDMDNPDPAQTADNEHNDLERVMGANEGVVEEMGPMGPMEEVADEMSEEEEESMEEPNEDLGVMANEDNDDIENNNDRQGNDNNVNEDETVAGVATVVDDNDMSIDMGQEEDHEDGHESGYNLRPQRERSYTHRFGYNNATFHFNDQEQGIMDGYIHDGWLFVADSGEISMATPQMPMSKGLKIFGDQGVAAVKKEITQLHERGVIRGVHKTSLTSNQLANALGYLMFLKRKRNGKIKGRGCADGRKQRLYIPREDAASPTVTTEAVFLTAIIDALEHREVAVVDIPGAFMQADMDPDVHMRIDGIMAKLLMEVDEAAYRPYLTYEKGKPVIYVDMLKALYGTLRAARLFWEKLSIVLTDWGFILNDYDTCVANKNIDGTQCTITWHVDDLKISHVKEEAVSMIINQLIKEFGQLGELSISRGKRHDYLGMYLDFSEPGVLQVDMTPYVATVLDDIPQDMIGKALTPAAAHLFLINENCKPLDATRAELFHSMTMQLAYLAHRGRPDIRTAIAFLCTRVSKPDEDDYRKLIRVIKYLQNTKDLILRLEANKHGVLRWWIDASYAAHNDMKGHTGANLCMGRGSVISHSTKQKLVARSSTESELIGAHDVLPTIVWTRNFLKSQGVKIKDVVVYQDNQSAMLLENNGRMSSTKRTKHINIRYFYIKDRIQNKDLRIEYCPTDQMVADFYTKPLQGQLFYQHRDAIMNILPTSPYHSAQRSVLRNHADGIAKKHGNATEQLAADDGENWTVVERKAGKRSERKKVSFDE